MIRIAIVGLGPRGLAVLDRICAHAPARLFDRDGLAVHVIDPHLGTGGSVWRHDQRSDLLMNTVASQITMFVDESVECEGPVVPGPSLDEWARRDDVPEHLREEARRLGPDSYPTRAFYGHYLTWKFKHVIATAPAKVTIVLHSDTAIDLRDAPDGSQQVKLVGGRTIEGLHAVVLAQGHLPTRPTRAERAHRRFAAEHGLRHLPPMNPADVELDDIRPGEPTVLRGMGLNFFDHVTRLTVGRGGRFRRRSDGSLVYQRSGAEPRIIAGSRRGVPYHARGDNQKGASGRHVPLFLVPKVIDWLRDRADRGEPVNFRTDLWPLIDREIRTVYYTTLVRSEGGDHVQFLHEFTADPGEEVVARYGISRTQRWDWDHVATPYQRAAPRTTAQYRRWLRAYLVRDAAEARRGNVDSPLKAALDVLRDLRNEIRLVVDHAGLSGDSYRDDLQRWYMPLNAYLSIGPPARRIEELVALMDAGVVEVMGPRLRIRLDPARRAFVASSELLDDVEAAASTLIEARLPEPDLRNTADPLLRGLLARGECRLHRIPMVGGGSYPTGGLAVTRRPYRLVDLSGNAHPRRFGFGVPTETVHWITAAGIRPGVNSVILSDADALARACLAASLDARPQPVS